MQMEVHNAQLFNMQPVIPGKEKLQQHTNHCAGCNMNALRIIMFKCLCSSGETTKAATPQDTTQTYRDKV